MAILHGNKVIVCPCLSLVCTVVCLLVCRLSVCCVVFGLLAGFCVLLSAGSVWAGWRCVARSRAPPTGGVLRPKAAQSVLFVLLFVCPVCLLFVLSCVCVCPSVCVVVLLFVLFAP